MQEPLEQQILALIRQPSKREAGFRLLLRTYQERLYWHIRHLVISHEDANDVLQNVLIKVYRNIDKFEGKAKLYTWLYRIATNETITFLNKKKKRTISSLTQVTDNLIADDYFRGDEIQIKLQQAISQLPNKQRLVFSMRYFEEMTYQEISTILETSVGGLKASYHHAVKKIERFIREN